ncbi:hypothetical protein [Verminephrobacter eiseniae]|uniref:hypothetical protein n=1 Tax=Verminephrobacter eiseniae TaxID=364317 RepID=UPI00223780F9|nr:hypothetical protein [Verminephrobacter eiseniae]MCW5231059.1 hypothetical protein [Verminephrobacter eiseniae]MCW5292792.1 hypothetical protein [Verminephrobacter eiseniae]MCW8184685.1 hypothetical protein [Verminephrobacter eiseniae]MCW8223361.1 hypothetical protein [Verminephrobacter eiseniae]MCW8234512.1 hypothetical protein [Verminephrobacter eiseniae]
MIAGTAAADGITGTTGDDMIDGQAGADVIDGGHGNDTLSGGADAGALYGENGNDTLAGPGPRSVVRPAMAVGELPHRRHRDVLQNMPCIENLHRPTPVHIAA